MVGGTYLQVYKNEKMVNSSSSHPSCWLTCDSNEKIPPPKKIDFFGEVGAFFLDKIVNFDFGRDKKFRLDFGIERTLLATNRPISTRSPQLNFQKYGFFRYFENFLNFLSSIYDFAPKLHINHWKWFFWDSLDPKDYFYPVLVQFWKSKILNFSQFFQYYSVVWIISRSTWTLLICS